MNFIFSSIKCTVYIWYLCIVYTEYATVLFWFIVVSQSADSKRTIYVVTRHWLSPEKKHFADPTTTTAEKKNILRCPVENKTEKKWANYAMISIVLRSYSRTLLESNVGNFIHYLCLRQRLFQPSAFVCYTASKISNNWLKFTHF